MKLPRTVDTAILFVSVLASRYGQGPVSLSSIANRHGLSFLFLKKLARYLKSAGIIISHEGINGGYVLSRPPQEINVWQIIEAVSGDDRLPPPQTIEKCPLNSQCLPQNIRTSIGNALKISLANITLVNFQEVT
jgi:Rrf2 family protein